jgi:sec-independent protein translocase protein TatC
MIYLFTAPILSFDKPFLSTHLTEPLYATLQICSGITLFIVYPLLLYHLWSFLLSSLLLWERRRRNRSFQSSYLLLSLSLFSVYQFLIPLFLQFFFQFEIGGLPSGSSEGTGVNPITSEQLGGVKILIEPRIGPFVSWCFHIFFTFSLLSQAPLLLFYLYRRGILTPSLLFKNRRSALLFLVIGTSLLSPPDFWSQLFLLLLFFTIYEICIWFSFFLEGRRGSLDLSKF